MDQAERKPKGVRVVGETMQFIDGAYTPGTGKKTFENRSPVDNSLVSHVHEATAADVEAAVKAARAALEGPWGKMPLAQRADLLHAVADGINKRFNDFLDAEVADTGKPVDMASHLDIPR